MTARWLLLVGMTAWIGMTLLLSQLRWFSRRPLDERLRPYVPGGWESAGRSGILSVESFREVITPAASALGDTIGRVLGVDDDLETRLRRIHRDEPPSSIRVRQLTHAIVALIAASIFVLVLDLPVPVGVLFVLGAPFLAFLMIEKEIGDASEDWQRRIELELPIVAEQFGMLLSAGYSLGGAIDRISRRGRGCCSRDLDRVSRRIRQGLDESEALREWAEISGVPAVQRFVGVLALNRDTADLGRLITEEARSVRREVQRQLAEIVDRRAQQVWIPVTVATLLPGTLFLAVPFLRAMDVFRT